MKYSFFKYATICFTAGLLLFTSIACNRKFDEPPLNVDPDIPITMTIKELKEKYLGAGIFQTIEEDKTISGIVTADDRSGNFYKQIVIQDETGGIPILLDGNSVYTTYPVGRRLFVKLKGMMLGDYGGTIQLGLDSTRSDDGRFLNVGRIPVARFDEFIVRGSYGNTVAPKIIKPGDFTKKIDDPLLSMLVQIDNAEFKSADLIKNYGDTSLTESAVNFTVQTCNKESIILRNSSYARFASIKVAQGNGSLIVVAGIFNSTIQMTIRDTGDVKFNGPRCGEEPVIPKTIEELRAMYSGKDDALGGNYSVGGTIISDAVNKNITNGGFIMQSGNKGVFVYAGSAISYAIGDSVLLILSADDSLINYRGSLELKLRKSYPLPAAFAKGKIVEPIEKTIAAINTGLGLPLNDAGNLENTLIKINTVVASPAGLFSGNKDLTDASGTIKLFTQFAATFAGEVLPTGNQEWTGYASNFGTSQQFAIRNTDDVTGFVPSAGFSVTYDFAGVTTSSGALDPSTPPVAQGITFGSFNAIGVSANSSGSGRFSFTAWPIGALDRSDEFEGAIDTKKYYEITITPAQDVIVDLFKIRFTLRRSGTGVRQASVRSSRDGFANNLPASIEPVNENLSIAALNIFQIKDDVTEATEGCTIMPGTEFINLTGPVTFRFYGFNAESASGTFSIDDVRIEGGTR